MNQEAMGETEAAGSGRAREQIGSDLRTLASHAEELIRATAELSEDSIAVARDRLSETLHEAQQRLMDTRNQASIRTRRAAEAADHYAHEKPWQIAAAALLMGMALGYLSAPRHH